MYTFSIGWFFVGIIIFILSCLLVLFHEKIADNLGAGVSDYDRYKLWGLIGCAVGFVVMLNLHTLILRTLLGNIFGGGQ